MSPSRLRTAIIGAGPAGLTLGVLLHNKGIPFTIYELRQRPTDEELDEPAGSLDLHEDTGLAAIKECGLLDEFYSFTGDCTEAQKISDKHGNIVYADDGKHSDRPEISRHKIVKLLLSRLPAAAFKWGHKLTSAASSIVDGNVQVELDFGLNGKRSFDLVVGADGAWSKIRPLLTATRPTYAGIHNITLNIRQITTEYPQIADFVGDGTFMALEDRHAVCSQRSAKDSAKIYLFVATDDEHFATTSGLGSSTPVEAKKLIIGDDSLLGGWGAEIKELVAMACDDESVYCPGEKLDIKSLHKLPAGHSWEHQSGATLIGDAAHLMNPPAGEGVNIAMEDALLLSRAIIKAYDDTGDNVPLHVSLDTLIGSFEAGMAVRAKEMAEGTLEISEMMFGRDDGAAAMVEFFKSFGPPPELT